MIWSNFFGFAILWNFQLGILSFGVKMISHNYCVFYSTQAILEWFGKNMLLLTISLHEIQQTLRYMTASHQYWRYNTTQLEIFHFLYYQNFSLTYFSTILISGNGICLTTMDNTLQDPLLLSKYMYFIIGYHIINANVYIANI